MDKATARHRKLRLSKTVLDSWFLQSNSNQEEALVHSAQVWNAVNSHDALVEACESVANSVRIVAPSMPKKLQPGMFAIAEELEQAIAKAGE